MVRPIGKRVIVKAQTFKEENVSESGIVFKTEQTDSGIESVTKATIISVGKVVTEVTPKDKIYYETHAGHKVDMNGEEVIILDVANILGVIDE